jgi:hypothetical protein
VDRWQELEAQTVAEQQQCRLMYILYTERLRSEKQLSVMLQEINADRFDDLQSLETMCRTVQVDTVYLPCINFFCASRIFFKTTLQSLVCCDLLRFKDCILKVSKI